MRLTLDLLRFMEWITEIKGVRAMTKVDIDWIISFLGGWLQYVGCISGRQASSRALDFNSQYSNIIHSYLHWPIKL